MSGISSCLPPWSRLVDLGEESAARALPRDMKRSRHMRPGILHDHDHDHGIHADLWQGWRAVPPTPMMSIIVAAGLRCLAGGVAP